MREKPLFKQLAIWFGLVLALTPVLPAFAIWRCTDGTPCSVRCYRHFGKGDLLGPSQCCCGIPKANCPACSHLHTVSSNGKHTTAIRPQRCAQVAAKRPAMWVNLNSSLLLLALPSPIYRFPENPLTEGLPLFSILFLPRLWRFLSPPPSRAPPSSL